MIYRLPFFKFPVPNSTSSNPMHAKLLTVFTVLCFSVYCMADANKYTGYSRRHRGMARLSSSEMSSDALQKRFDNARFTFYDVSK